MSETNGNTPTSVSMRRRAGSPRARGGSNTSDWGPPGAEGLTHGDVWEAVNAANRDEVEKTYGEDSVRVLRVVLPGAPRFDSSGVSHGDSACVTSGDRHDSHGCRSVVGERAPQPAGDTDGITDGVSCGMSGGRVERDAGALTIDALAGDANTHHSSGRRDSGDSDENIRGRSGCGVGCCGGGDGSAVIDTESSPQHPTRRIPDTEVSLFDVPVVLERRYVTTAPNGDEETAGFSSAGAATGVDVSVCEEAGVPMLGKSRKYISSSNTSGDACVDATGGAPGVDGDDGHCRVSADDGGRRAHTTCRGCERVGSHADTDTPVDPGAQDWEHWEWTGGGMRLVLTMQQRRWNDNHLGYHKDMDYERGAEMVAAAYMPDDTTAGCWVLVGMWVVRNPTPDSVQQFISRWLDDGIQLASSVMRSRYDYPVFFDRILLSWDDTVKAIGHAIQGEGWRVDWEWDFNRGADGRVVLTNTKDESAPALVFVDPARCQQTGAGAGMGIRGGAGPAGGDTWRASKTDSSAPGAAITNSPGEATAVSGLRAAIPVSSGAGTGLSTGSDGNRINNETANTAAARRAGAGADAVGAVESEGCGGVVPTVGGRAAINDDATRADGVSSCGGTNSTGGGVTANTPGVGHSRDKETPCQSASQLNNATHCSSCSVVASGAGVPATRVPGEDACTLTRRGDTGTTGLAHGDDAAAPGGEKAGMFTNRHPQNEHSFTGEGGVGAELGFIGARPHECHAGDLSNADAGATVSGERHNSGTCATGVAGAVRGHTPAQESPPAAPGTHGGGNRWCGASKEDSATIGVAGSAGSGGHEGGGITSDDGPVGVSYGMPDGGFSPIVYVDYNHQEQDWFEVYGPDYTDDEGELLPDVAAAVRHSIPAVGGVVPASLGSFLQVVDVVKWWLGVDGNTSINALGALRNAMKENPLLGG